MRPSIQNARIEKGQLNGLTDPSLQHEEAFARKSAIAEVTILMDCRPMFSFFSCRQASKRRGDRLGQQVGQNDCYLDHLQKINNIFDGTLE
jgi:hypothetical protein